MKVTLEPPNLRRCSFGRSEGLSISRVTTVSGFLSRLKSTAVKLRMAGTV